LISLVKATVWISKTINILEKSGFVGSIIPTGIRIHARLEDFLGHNVANLKDL
jgi:hypothetical protein